MQIVPDHDAISEHLHAFEILFYISAVAAAGICLVTVAAAEFIGLFSMRLALRGGQNAVEETVAKARGEYHLCLMMLIAGIECFLFSIPWLCIVKMPPAAAVVGCLITFPAMGMIGWFYKRVKCGRVQTACMVFKKNNLPAPLSILGRSEHRPGVCSTSQMLTSLPRR